MIRSRRNRARAIAALILAAATAWATNAVGAMTMYLTHAYGEFVDRGNVSVYVNLPPGLTWNCLAPVVRTQAGNSITLTGATAPAFPPLGCGLPFAVPPLPAGTYSVTARLVGADGSVADSATQSVQVLPIEGRCNPDPALSPSIMTRPKEPADAFVARVNSDPAFKARLGNPALRFVHYQAFPDEVHFDYPPLDDIAPAIDRLTHTGLFDFIARNGWACFATSPPDVVAAIVEFYHAGLDHYFYSGDPGEIAAIDAGAVGAWSRTGKSFRAVIAPGCIPSSSDTVVYRFSGVPGKGPSSHFFTRDRAECYAVDKSRQWLLEGIPFYSAPPKSDGSCELLTTTFPPQQRVPLYRLWRPFGDSNHRFTTERSVVSEMVARGWVEEGATMCVLPST